MIAEFSSSHVALLDGSRKTLENVVVLHLAQAMLGLVGPNLRAVGGADDAWPGINARRVYETRRS